jgi:signal transduction histidine kinase
MADAMALPAHVPISRKLTRMNMLVSTSSLLMACTAFFVYDLITFRDAMVRNLSIQAQMVGSTSVSALVFNDEQTAAETLAGLQAAPDVLTADILAPGGATFASYRRSGALPGAAVPPIPAGQQEVHVFALDSLGLARRILLDGSPAGVIYLRSDLRPLYARLGSYALIAAAVLLVSALAALVISRLARRAITAPIVNLAELAHRVAESNDYTVRATAGAAASSEYATVVVAFNDMLARIQQRDRELAAAHTELEERVRQRTEELDLAYKDLEAFSYSVSHDLRAPLRHVTGFSTLLKQHVAGSLDERGRRYLDTLIAAASRMGRLIDDLLAFSRMGRASLSPRRVDLAQLVREAQAEIAPETTAREIVWDVHTLPSVYADPALLRPVMVNLLSNAVKYSSTRPVARIEIGSSRSETGEAVVFVRDNGVGFDMKYADKLFGVFQRLHSSDEFGGTGIGLANVKRIISRHGGRTWAHGVVNQGATFYFSLPEPVS